MQQSSKTKKRLRAKKLKPEGYSALKIMETATALGNALIMLHEMLKALGCF